MMNVLSVRLENTEDVEDRAFDWLLGVLTMCGLEDTYNEYDLTEFEEIHGNKVRVEFRKPE